jgi:hypothetical protein
MKNTSRLIFGLLLVLGAAAGAGGIEGSSAVAQTDTDDLAAALEAASAAESPRYHLIVHRTDEDGQRSFEVFPGGVAIWNHRAQITLPSAVRASLLGILLKGGFADMAPSYGGKRTPELREAALRVSCRVALELDGVEKRSVQQADGEQSAELAALADALLDLVEPLAAKGVTADDLDDGLRKLAGGELAPEVFRLRFVWLPEDGDGEILSMRNGLESRKAYSPGRRIGDESVSELTSDRLTGTVEALLGADVASLPVNLWSAEHVELEVAVFGHRTSVIGRDFSRLASDEQSEAQKRFRRLIAFLCDDGSALAPSPNEDR